MRNKIRITGYILLSTICSLICACNSQKQELQEKVEKLRSKAINIPYDRMGCWTNDSIRVISPWNKAKLKLVHYIDSATDCNGPRISVSAYLTVCGNCKSFPLRESCHHCPFQ